MKQFLIFPIFPIFPIFLSITLFNLIPILPLTASNPKTTLDPKQLRALQSLNLPTSTDPCLNPPPLKNAIICDKSNPFRHLISLHLVNTPDDISLSFTALKSLYTLQDLSFINCPSTTTDTNRFPVDLASNLQSFTCINSLRKLSSDMISQLENVINLTISNVPIIKGNGPQSHDMLINLKKLTKLTISHANLTSFLPKSWNKHITHIDLSYNNLNGTVPVSLTELQDLVSLDLSSNELTGELPVSMGDLIGLKSLSLSMNSLSGLIPVSMASMPELEHLDLSSNNFNGTIPKFLTRLKGLKYLNLEKNNFEGIIPFNETFIKKLSVFKIGENVNLCYNHSSFSPSVKLGIAPCDKYGMPSIPPTKAESNGDDDSDDYSDEDSGTEDETSSRTSSGPHGPNKVVVGLAITISSIVVLLIFLIFLARKCA